MNSHLEMNPAGRETGNRPNGHNRLNRLNLIREVLGNARCDSAGKGMLVTVDNREVGRIGHGLLVLLGVHRGDTDTGAEDLAARVRT